MPDLNSASLSAQSVGSYTPPSLEAERERLVPLIKEFRQKIDALIQEVPHEGSKAELAFRGFNAPLNKESYAQVRIHLTDAKMWAGKMLEGLGNPFPAELADKANVK